LRCTILSALKRKVITYINFVSDLDILKKIDRTEQWAKANTLPEAKTTRLGAQDDKTVIIRDAQFQQA
jgi:hypothetical protein